MTYIEEKIKKLSDYCTVCEKRNLEIICDDCHTNGLMGKQREMLFFDLLILAEKGNMYAQYNLGSCYVYGNGVEKDENKAVEWYRKSAEQGYARAQNNLGVCYYDGNGVEKDYVKAVEWYRKSAEQGYANAQSYLGICYYYGNGVEKDYVKAVEWYRKSAEQGYANAQSYLGICYYYGNGVEKDYVKAVEWYRKSAEQGYANAQCNLGVCYERGEGVEKDEVKAVEWYRKSAEQGYASAQKNLGVCYENGRGVEKDEVKAVEWYRKSAEQGEASAQYRLGSCYYLGIGVEKDSVKAVEWWIKSAGQGYAQAQFIFGKCYYNGEGVEKDEVKAVEWYRKSAEQGNAGAQFDLGFCYEWGSGVEKDEKKAVEWYRKSAEQGYASAQCNLGVCYKRGEGVEKDEVKAVEWYRKSAEQGYAIAQYNLGHCYECGSGVEKDEKKAVEWYRKSAEQGYAIAQNNLGLCYEYGRGVEKDEVKAVEWYRKSAEQGYASAQYNLGVCYELAKGVEEDEKKAVEWYTKSAEQGYARAQYNLGHCYECGSGVEKDESKAVKWYIKSAKQGYVKAILGLRKRNVRDASKGVEWYTKSAEQGYAWTQCELGKYYEYGRDVKKDEVQAVEWYTKSAEQGNAEAQYHLGHCYEYGTGVEKDYVKAVEWYRKSAEQGYAPARYHLGLGISVEKEEMEVVGNSTKVVEHVHKEAGSNTASVDKHFDEYQTKVLNVGKGYHLVLAPPGCGKTELLTQRVLKAKSEGYDFSDMLCLTFTNRAARGMQERIEKNKNEYSDVENLFVGNLHKLCNRFLSENKILAGNVSIIDELDQIDILNEFGLENYNVGKSFKERITVQDVQKMASHMYQIEHGHPMSVWLNWEVDAGKQLFVKELAKKYIQYKKEHNLIDFDEELLITYTHLMDISYRSLKYTSFKWIQIDEVQDLNALQFAIVDKITAPKDFTVVYLGDEQQAIFSFMGAQLENLNMLKKRCNEVLRLRVNYRSPKYLLDMYNTYAIKELNVAKDLLPTAYNQRTDNKGNLVCHGISTFSHELTEISNYIKKCVDRDSKERIGILVRTNKDADRISQYLSRSGVSHFKISGQDCFKCDSFKNLMAHFSVVSNDANFMEWARLLFCTNTVKSLSDARHFVKEMRDLAITPSDFLFYDRSSYVQEFYNSYLNKEIVIFDTETTGKNVFEDDIIQIAAIKVFNGKMVPNSEFNIILETNREIPRMLGDIVNPMCKEYEDVKRDGKLYKQQKGLEAFIKYIGKDEVLGHNVNYDYNILKNSLIRYCTNAKGLDDIISVYWDSLKLIRLLEPKMKAYKLKHCLEVLHLEGANSHKADDDILATKSLVDYCAGKIPSKSSSINSFIQLHSNEIKAFRQSYRNLYVHTKGLLYDSKENGLALKDELKYVYGQLVNLNFITPIEVIDYMLEFIQRNILKVDDKHFLDQVSLPNLMAVKTLTEADLCDSDIIKEKVYLMTVYKAKGLEFENVYISDVSDGRYPWFDHWTRESQLEDARLLYVAMTRSKRDIYISYVTDTGRYMKRISPFLKSVGDYFGN